MGRLDVDPLFRHGVHPVSSIFAAREDQRVDPLFIDHAHFEIAIGWRERNGQPFFRKPVNLDHNYSSWLPTGGAALICINSQKRGGR